MNKYKSQLLVWSNLSWLFPAYLAIGTEKWVLTLPAIMVMFLSMNFHYRPTAAKERIDTVFSLLYISLGPALLTMSANPLQAWISAIVVTLFAGGVWLNAKHFDHKQNLAAYNLTHALWHVLASCVTSIIYLHYLGYL